MKRFITTIKIDVSENEEDVLSFLHSNKIFERGHILSPEKEVWFKSCHYIQFHSAWCYLDNKKTMGNWYYYTYVTKDKKLEGELLETITLDDLKELKPFK